MKAVLILLGFSCALFATHVTRVSSDMLTESYSTCYREEYTSREKCEDTALHRAIGMNDSAMVTQLLKEGADGYAMFHCVKQNNFHLTQKLIHNNANITRLSKEGESYIHLAARHSSISVMNLLLENGLSPDTVSLNGETPLEIAVKNNNLDIIRTLINHNSNINRLSKLGESYLHFAVSSSSTPLVKYLLKEGIAVDTVSQKDETPLTIAVQTNSYEMTEVLLEYKADMKRLTQQGQTYKSIALKNMALNSSRALRNHCISVDEKDSAGGTAIYYAVVKDDIDTASVLAELGADLSQMHTLGNTYDGTLLHIAAKQGSTRVTRWLIQRGFDVNVLGGYGYIPLHLAAWYGGLDEVKLLLQLGACINCRDNAGWTPLRYTDRHDVFDYLKSKGGIR